MKKNKAALALAVATWALAGVLALTGCSSNDEKESSIDKAAGNTPAYDLAVIYATRANSGAEFSSAQNYIAATVRDQGNLAVVSADGKPQAITGSFVLTNNKEKRQAIEMQQNLDQVMGLAASGGLCAQSGESNIYEALCAANTQLGVIDTPTRSNLLIIVDSGVSTAGAVDFTDPLTKKALLDPSILIAKMRENGEVERLDNIDKVIWYGMGAVSDPESAIGPGTRGAMEDLYRAVLVESGIDESAITFEAASASGKAAGIDVANLPEVTVVNMPKIAQDEDGRPVRLGDTVELNEAGDKKIEFAKNAAGLVDEGATLEAIGGYIDQLVSFPDLTVTLRGYTDTTGSAELNLSLSEQRANTVKQLMVDNGVNPSQIIAIGMGETTGIPDDTDDPAARRVELTFE